jgi:hypothetical protein
MIWPLLASLRGRLELGRGAWSTKRSPRFHESRIELSIARCNGERGDGVYKRPLFVKLLKSLLFKAVLDDFVRVAPK